MDLASEQVKAFKRSGLMTKTATFEENEDKSALYQHVLYEDIEII